MQGLQNIELKLRELQIVVSDRVKKVLAIESEKSIRKNFDTKGRPEPWPERKRISKKQRGTNLMVISGALKNVRAVPTGDGIKLVIDPRAKEYAEIHQEGGVINMPARQLKFRKKQSTGKTVFASTKHKRITKTTTSKPYTIRIPKRAYLVIPDEDFPRILNAIKSNIKI